jgi:hypothetical protein
MQSKRLKSNCTLRLRMAVNHRIALSMLRVSSSTFVSNLQERSLIRKITRRKSEEIRVNAAPRMAHCVHRGISKAVGREINANSSPIETSPYSG